MIDMGAVQAGRRLPLEVFRCLAESVVRQAVADLHNDAYRDDARRFFDGRSFDAYCEILGWNSRRARQNLYARIDELMYPPATPAAPQPLRAS
jgi:hypothetical protein